MTFDKVDTIIHQPRINIVSTDIKSQQLFY